MQVFSRQKCCFIFTQKNSRNFFLREMSETTDSSFVRCDNVGRDNKFNTFKTSKQFNKPYSGGHYNTLINAECEEKFSTKKSLDCCICKIAFFPTSLTEQRGLPMCSQCTVTQRVRTRGTRDTRESRDLLSNCNYLDYVWDYSGLD